MANLDGAPWFEPPSWWRDGLIDGLTWDELLQREWTRALNEPPSPRERQMREWCRKIGASVARMQTEAALMILTEPEPEEAGNECGSQKR